MGMVFGDKRVKLCERLGAGVTSISCVLVSPWYLHHAEMPLLHLCLLAEASLTAEELLEARGMW